MEDYFAQFADEGGGEAMGGGGGDEGLVIEPEEEKEKWELASLPSHKRAREELGEPGQRQYCFGCVYELSTEGVPMCNENFRELVMVASKCIGQMSIESLGKEIERLYEKFRRETNKKKLHEDGAPLPEWKASSIVEHLIHHNVDPQVQIWVQLVHIQELIATEMESIVEVGSKSKKPRLRKEGVQNYERLVKLWHHVSARPLDKMFAYRKDGRIDTESINQPFITRNQKSIVDYYNNAAKKTN